MVDVTLTSVLGGAFPKLEGVALPNHFNHFENYYFEGFASISQSAIQLPTVATGSVTFFNAAGATVWTKTPSGFLAAMDDFVQFWMNDAATLLFVIARDTATSPDTFGTFTIDVAGAILQIGSGDQPATDFANAAATSWNLSGSGLDFDGSGDFVILSTASPGADNVATISKTTGLFTSDPAPLFDAGHNTALFTPIRSTDETYVARFALSAELATAEISSNFVSAATSFPFDTVAGIITNAKLMHWKDYIISTGGGTGRIKSTQAQFDTWTTKVRAIIGLET